MDLKNIDRKNTDLKNTDLKNMDLENMDIKNNDPYSLGRDGPPGGDQQSRTRNLRAALIWPDAKKQRLRTRC